MSKPLGKTLLGSVCPLYGGDDGFTIESIVVCLQPIPEVREWFKGELLAFLRTCVLCVEADSAWLPSSLTRLGVTHVAQETHFITQAAQTLTQ